MDFSPTLSSGLCHAVKNRALLAHRSHFVIGVSVEEERKEIEEKLMTISCQVSNLDKSIDFVVKFALELPLKWVPADYNTKQRIQFYSSPKALAITRKQMKIEPK